MAPGMGQVAGTDPPRSMGGGGRRPLGEAYFSGAPLNFLPRLLMIPAPLPSRTKGVILKSP